MWKTQDPGPRIAEVHMKEMISVSPDSRIFPYKKWKSFSCVRLFMTPWTIHSREFSRPENEWVAFPFSRVSSQPWDQTQVSRIAGRFFTVWAPREAPQNWTEVVPYPFSRGSSCRSQIRVSCIADGFFTSWATRKPCFLFFLFFFLVIQKYCSAKN